MDGNSAKLHDPSAEPAAPADEMLSLCDLVRITRKKSAEGRRQRFDTMRAVCWGARLEPIIEDIAVMAEIIRDLVHETEMSIRLRLAARLAERAETPDALLMELGNEALEIAHAVLAQNESLLDDELMEAVQFRAKEYQLSHQVLNDRRGDADAPDDDMAPAEDPASPAAGRPPLPEDTRDYLAAQTQRLDALRKPRLRRQDIGHGLNRRLHWWVAAALRRHIMASYEIPTVTLDESIEDAVQAILSNDQTPDKSTTDDPSSPRRLSTQSNTDPRLLVRLLRDGEITLFISLFSRMTGLRYRLVRRFLFEPDGVGLAIACKAVGIAKTDFASICRVGLQAAARGVAVDDEVAGAVNLFNHIDRDAAEAMLCLWRRDQEYLNALRLLDQPSVRID